MQEAEILLDLPVKAGYRLLARGQWAGVGKRFGSAQWRISRSGLESLGEGEGVGAWAEDAGHGYVRVPRLTLRQYERRIEALEAEKAGLVRQLQRKSVILRKLVEGIELDEFAIERA